MKNSFSLYPRGFTLVELMIVIAIIGILATALFPTVTQYIARSRNAARVFEIRQLNLAFKTFFIDHGRTPQNPIPLESAQCIGLNDGERCWRGYVFNASVATSKGRTGGVVGSTVFTDELRTYHPKMVPDPLSTRAIGDRYIFSSAPGDVLCNAVSTVWAGGWILWQPEKIAPTSNSQCLGIGQWGCCSGIGCGSHYFCLTRVDDF